MFLLEPAGATRDILFMVLFIRKTRSRGKSQCRQIGDAKSARFLPRSSFIHVSSDVEMAVGSLERAPPEASILAQMR
jgi:hypothetical protein